MNGRMSYMIRFCNILRAIAFAWLMLTGCALFADPAEATIVSPANSITVAMGQAVGFSATSSSGGRLNYVVNDYLWTCTDGWSGSGPNLNHAFPTPGTYTVNLTVTYSYQICKTWDLDGNCLAFTTKTGTATASRIITVTSASISSITPNAPSVNAGSSMQFSAIVSGAANTGITWSVSGGGTINSWGLFTAATAGTYWVTAVSVADPSKTSTTQVTVNSVVTGVSASPNSIGLKAGETTTFVASVSGLGGHNTAVTWSTTGGSITGGGVYTAPIAAGSYTVTATSVQDGSKRGSATVTVGAISVSTPIPQNGSVSAGSSLQFSATVSGAVNTGITWSVSGGGSINASGLFSATTTGTFWVTATSIADPSKASTTQVTVNSVVTGVSVAPSAVALKAGESTTFTASVTGLGGPSTAVTWSTTGGSITGGGVYTAPIAAGSYTVTAISAQDGSKQASATVTIGVISVSVPSPQNGTVNAGSTLQFSATVAGAVNTGVTWWVSGGGTINASGLFTATSAGTFTVRATSVVDGSKVASTQVTVNAIVTGVSVNPSTTSLKAGESTTFTATVSGQGGPSTAVTWSTTGGSITVGGAYVAPIAAGTYTVTATSAQDGSKQGSATVTVGVISVSTPSPQNGSVNAGSALQFSATVTGAVNTGVTWWVSGGGTINASGLFTATTAGTFTVRATSVVDGSKIASTQVTVNAIVTGVSVNPSTTSLKAGESTTFTATVSGQGGPNTAVTWSTTGGSITGGGVYTAPIAAGSYTVTATSVQDGSKQGSATVTIGPISVSLPSPQNGSVNIGSTLQFSASVSGAVNTGITWSVSGGTISASGLFTATTVGTFTVTATSAVDQSKFASTNVTVNSIVTGVSVDPATISLKTGEATTFTALVSGQGGPNAAVTWTTDGGTINGSGVYTAPSVVGEYMVVATSVQDGSQKGSARVTVTLPPPKQWVLRWKRDIVYMGTKELAEVDGLGVHVTLTDHLGSPRYVVGGAGAVESEQKFLPFGEALADPASSAKFAKGFTNHEQTDPSGLIYMQARFYAPMYGRFLSPDPARDQHFEETQSWNIYSYVRNNPTMSIDPDGMREWNLANRAMGALQVGFAFIEAAAGVTVTAGTGGLALPVGGAIILHAADVGGAGLQQVVTGEPTRTYTSQGIEAGAASLGASPENARAAGEVGDALLSTAGMIGGARASAGLPTGRPSSTPPVEGSRPAGVPGNWEATPAKKGEGTVYRDPANPKGNIVRDMKGDPKSPNPAQQKPYVKHLKNGQVVDAAGKPIPGPKPSATPEAHIPRDKFKLN